jgi:hypothetical protein
MAGLTCRFIFPAPCTPAGSFRTKTVSVTPALPEETTDKELVFLRKTAKNYIKVCTDLFSIE